MHSFNSLCRLLVCFYLLAVSHGFAGPARKTVTKEDLPTLDSTEPISAPPGVTSEQFYLPTYTLLRAGPVSFTRRLLGPKEYEKKVFKYMQDFKEDSLMTAQGNADAYLASPDNWVEQKYFEQKGTREIYDYGKPLPLERVILTSVWSIFTVGLFSRVFWQLLNGNRNLF